MVAPTAIREFLLLVSFVATSTLSTNLSLKHPTQFLPSLAPGKGIMFVMLMLDLEPGLQWSHSLQYMMVVFITGVLRCNIHIKLISTSQ